MLDFDLAELYQVSTSALNQSVKRNAKRFPPDFMFQITQEEFDSLKSQIVTSSWGGTRKLPNAFTEQGLAMLSGVLNSDTAIDMNIRVMRAFVSMRAFLLNGNIAAELNQLHCRVKKLERTSDETLEAINDLSEELEDLEADLYEDEDAEDEEDDSDDETEADDDDDNADVAGEPYYEVACPACGKTVYVSEDDLDAGEAICPSCKVAFEVALEDPEDDEAAESDGPVQYEVTCPACGSTAVFEEDELLDGAPKCPNCGEPLDFEVTEE